MKFPIFTSLIISAIVLAIIFTIIFDRSNTNTQPSDRLLPIPTPKSLNDDQSTLSTPAPTPNPATSPIVSITPSQTIISPLIITGTVPAGWMFEGVFPIKLVNTNKQTITTAQAIEVSPGSWQSGQPIQFTATLTFTSAGKEGFLVLENDNPSGLPENQKQFEIPVRFYYAN